MKWAVLSTVLSKALRAARTLETSTITLRAPTTAAPTEQHVEKNGEPLPAVNLSSAAGRDVVG